jgi:hypothetical protein
VTEPILLDVLGLRLRLNLNDALASATREAWASCLRSDGSGSPDIVLEQGTLLGPSDGSSLNVALEQLTQQVTMAAISARAGELLMLHACAVASGDRCAVFAGPSGMGKTTVAATLGRRWHYVTDECVAVETDGSVLPFPKPLSIVTPGTSKRQLAPAGAGLPVAEGRPRPVGVFLLQREPGLGAATVTRPSAAQSVALLASHTSFLTSLSGPLGVMASLLRAAGGLQVVSYSEAEQLSLLVELTFEEAS